MPIGIKNIQHWAGRMAQQRKVPAAESKDLNWIPSHHTAAENSLPCVPCHWVSERQAPLPPGISEGCRPLYQVKLGIPIECLVVAQHCDVAILGVEIVAVRPHSETP